MFSFVTALRRALQRAFRLPATLFFGRLSVVFAIVASGFSAAFGPPAQVGVAATPDPVTHLQVVVKSVQILDDREVTARCKDDN